MGRVAREAVLLTDGRMEKPRTLPFANGRVAFFSSPAPGRTGPNEDAAGLLSLDPERGVLVVADGLGGQPGGASAATMALDCLREAIDGAARDDRPVRGAVLDALEQANRRVMDLGGGAGTTFAALEVAGSTLRPYHVGDSGILVVGQRRKVKLQTISHSPVGYAVESGMLDEREAMHHDERHVVSNMVGMPGMRIEVGSPLHLAQRDTAVLATDGLFDNLDPSEVTDVVRAGPIDRAADRLARRAAARMRAPSDHRPSKPDDLTFVLFRPHRRAP